MNSRPLRPRFKLSEMLMTIVSAGVISTSTLAASPIVRDGEYYFVETQYRDQWAAQDKDIEAKLAQLRKANGGKRPNILYVLIDDVSFGQMGKPALNDVMGISTPRINAFARQGISLNRPARRPGPHF